MVASRTLHPKLYFSYNARTQQTTVITTDLNRLHLCMVQHLQKLSGMANRPEEIALLLIKWITVVQECFTATIMSWDAELNNPVCYEKHYLRLC